MTATYHSPAATRWMSLAAACALLACSSEPGESTTDERMPAVDHVSFDDPSPIAMNSPVSSPASHDTEDSSALDPRPLLDRNVPTALRTATFALG